MSWMEDRKKFLKKWNIDFDFCYLEYNMKRIPFERPYFRDSRSLEHYCLETRRLHKNICDAVESKENPYFADAALKDFIVSHGKNWDEKLRDLEQFIFNYNERYRIVYEQEKKG